MIRERTVELFDHCPEGNMNAANLIFMDLHNYNIDPKRNASRFDDLRGHISTKYGTDAENILIEGFRQILLDEATMWEPYIIQPLPGEIRVRMSHCGAMFLKEDGSRAFGSSKVEQARLVESREMLNLFDGYDADISILCEKLTSPAPLCFFINVDDCEGIFQILPKQTIVTLNKPVSDGGDLRISYSLSWSNEEHTKFTATKTHEFRL